MMGKYAEAKFDAASLIASLSEERGQIGLIIGGSTANRDYIIHIIPTPSPESMQQILVQDVMSTDEILFGEHALLVARSLPGGLYVLGLWTASPDNVFDPVIPKLRSFYQALCRVSRSAKGLHLLRSEKPNPECLMMHYNTKSKKLTCRNYTPSLTTPVEFVKSDQPSWCQIQCKIYLNERYAIKESDTMYPLRQQIQNVINQAVDGMKNSVVLLEGQKWDSNETLININKKRRAKHKNKEIDMWNINAHILAPYNSKSDIIEIDENSGEIRFLGVLGIRAYLNDHSTVDDVVHAIFTDITRTLTVRMDMHWDSVIEGESSVGDMIHEPPRRVLIPLVVDRVHLCDYLFPGEQPEEALMAVRDILAVDVSDNIKAIELEGPSVHTSNFGGSSPSESMEFNSPPIPDSRSNAFYIISLSVAAMVLILALIVHYLNYRKLSEEEED